MVFHVARTLHIVRLERVTAEFAEQLGVGLLDHVHERVQTAAMRHADGNFGHARAGSGFDDRLHGRNGALAAFQAEALGADETLLAEHFKALGLGQFLQNFLLGVAIKGGRPRRALNAALDPGFLLRILNMHEFHTNRAAIGAAQGLQNLARGGGFEAEDVIDEDRTVHVGSGEAIGGGVEFRVCLGGLQTKRIELGFEMAAHAIGADHHQRAQAVLGGSADVGGTRTGGNNSCWLGIFGGLAVFAGSRLRRLRLANVEAARRPGGTGAVFQHSAGIIAEGCKQISKAGLDRARIRHPAGIKIGQIGQVCAVERGCDDVDTSHGTLP